MTRSEEAKRLAAFLAEWQLDKTLDNAPILPDDSPSPTPMNQRCNDQTIQRINGPSVGDIWLLPPCSPVTRRRPVYVALVARRDGGAWLCAPFSRFSSPATDGEFLTRKDADAVSVLQAWNAGTVASETLSRGWMVGRLCAADLRAVASRILRGAPLPEDRRGARLAHPLDPRHDYVEEEKSLWFGLSPARAFADTPAPADAEAAEDNE